MSMALLLGFSGINTCLTFISLQRRNSALQPFAIRAAET
jgi:hypothetical protein